MLRDLAISAIGGSFGALATLGAVAVAIRYGVAILVKRIVR